jgi:hypothetical protein
VVRYPVESATSTALGSSMKETLDGWEKSEKEETTKESGGA